MVTDVLKKIVKALDDKKGNDIKVIKIDELTVVADYFVIVTGNSNTHIRALADEVEFQLEEAGMKADHIEGRATGWVVMDYAGVVAHIFTEEARNYYNLERLWEDAKQIDVDDILNA